MSAITVVIPTRNRPEQVGQAVSSLVVEGGPGFELVVVDQGDDEQTAQALRPWQDRLPLRLVRASVERGVAHARNLGADAARGEVVAFIDDDCTAQPGWLKAIAGALAGGERVALAFGNVIAAPHDRLATFVISYRRQGALRARSLRDKHRVEGIAGCMALRRSAWAALGGFDEQLGRGSRFHSAEEADLALRALQAGYEVAETDAAAVVHHGSRPRGDRDRVAHDYLHGLGAMYGKHLRCGRLGVALPLMRLAGRWAFSRPVVDYDATPGRWPRLRGFVTGLAAGLSSAVDRRQTLFLRVTGDGSSGR